MITNLRIQGRVKESAAVLLVATSDMKSADPIARRVDDLPGLSPLGHLKVPGPSFAR